MKQEISFIGAEDYEFTFKYVPALEDGERLKLEVEDGRVLCFTDEGARALAKFLKAITE